MEHIPRVPFRLDPLQAWIVLFVVQIVPRHAGSVPLWICEIDVRIVDIRAVTDATGHRHATGVRVYITVELADPTQVVFVLGHALPRRGVDGLEHRVALGDSR